MRPTVNNVRRHFMLYGLWLFLLAVLIGRLLLLMVWQPVVGGGHIGTVRWRMDEEHFHVRMTDDGRGHILFADGAIWSPPSTLQAGRVQQVPAAIGPELVGTIGQPDVWPSGARVLPEAGRTGLEYALDTLLMSKRPNLVGDLRVAANGGALDKAKLPVTKQPYTIRAERGSDVITTIDETDERRAEAVLQRVKVAHGAIVSLELPNAKVRVLASANHRRSDALVAATPGSIFKIMTAAAALDTHAYRAQARFFCDGQVHWPHVRMHCWRAHGKISFVDAIAQSCDVTFAQIGIHLGRRPLEAEAKRFGLFTSGIEKFKGHALLPGANSGVLYRQRGADAGLLANTAIGQEDVRMSPLQGALMAATIAEHGQYRKASLIDGVQKGRHRETYVPQFPSVACDAFTADVISQGMWAAVHAPKGTAHALNALPIAAKTGTAELPNGNVNAWLIGYQVNEKDEPVRAFALCVENEAGWAAHKKLFEMAQAWFGNLPHVTAP